MTTRLLIVDLDRSYENDSVQYDRIQKALSNLKVDIAEWEEMYGLPLNVVALDEVVASDEIAGMRSIRTSYRVYLEFDEKPDVAMFTLIMSDIRPAWRVIGPGSHPVFDFSEREYSV